MVKKDSFVSFEEKPILDFTDDFLFALGLLIFLSNRFVDILLFALIGVSGLHD
jgi:hypothetical protein